MSPTEKAVRMVENGKSVSEAAKRQGITANAVYIALSKRGISVRELKAQREAEKEPKRNGKRVAKSSKAAPATKTDRAIALLREGASISEAASKIGCSYQTVYVKARALGLMKKKANGKSQPKARKKGRKLAQSVDLSRLPGKIKPFSRTDRAVALVRDEGYTVQEAAREIGITRTGIYLQLEKEGLHHRRKKDEIPTKAEQAIDYVREGYTVAAAAKKVKCEPSGVYREMRRRGIKRPFCPHCGQIMNRKR